MHKSIPELKAGASLEGPACVMTLKTAASLELSAGFMGSSAGQSLLFSAIVIPYVTLGGGRACDSRMF